MKIVEVFKTNVETAEQAEQLARVIHESFPEYTVNFDLKDCDRVLRVESSSFIRENDLLNVLHANGVDATVLTDEIPPSMSNQVILSAPQRF